MGENSEDLLDIFAAVALMAMAPNTAESISDDALDRRSAICYRQAYSMLRVREKFIKND